MMNSTQVNLIEMIKKEAQDPEFRAALLAALNETEAPAKKKTRTVAPIDPIRSYLDGTLEDDIAPLGVDELRAVIREYHLDSARQTVRWSVDRLRPYILDRAKARANQGTAFLHFQG